MERTWLAELNKHVNKQPLCTVNTQPCATQGCARRAPRYAARSPTSPSVLSPCQASVKQATTTASPSLPSGLLRRLGQEVPCLFQSRFHKYQNEALRREETFPSPLPTTAGRCRGSSRSGSKSKSYSRTVEKENKQHSSFRLTTFRPAECDGLLVSHGVTC